MSGTLTLFDAQKRLTKRMTKVGGQISKESAALSRAKAQRVEVANARELAHLLDNLESTQALAYGVTERLSAAIGPRDYLGPGEISRSRENFAWPQGAGVLFLDLDGNHDTDDVPRLREILATAMPELADAPQVWTRSASGGIRDTETGEVHQGGLHAYMLVADAAAIPRIGRQVYDALWLAGWGYYMLSAAASVLDRCLIDEAVFQPERLDYAAAPELGEGLERVGGTVVAVHNDDAEPLNPARIAPMSDNEMARLAVVKRDARMAIKPDMERERRAVLDSLPAEKRESRRLQYLAADRGELCGDAVLYFSDGSTACASDILGNVSTYAGKRLADPLEPGYAGGDNRIAMVTDSGAIYSHAHGGRLFRIVEAPQEAPEGVVALDPEPDTRDIVAACYRARASAVQGGVEVAADEVGASRAYAASVWNRHLAEQASPLHAATQPVETFDTFNEVANAFSAGQSLFTLAKLGTGKSRELGGRAVCAAQADGRPVLAVTVLRALTWQNASTFDAEHYSDHAEILSASNTVSTTVHSMGSSKLDGFIDRLAEQKGVVVIDEAAAVSELLFTAGGILDDRQRYEILRRLEQLVAAGVKFLMLDGDATPCASVLADTLGCRVVKCTEQHYADPLAAVYPVQRQEDAETGKKVSATPCHANIVEALQRGERVVLATDSREQADRLHATYAPMATGGALCLHSGNADETEQVEFRANPNAQAERWQLVTYSPALSVGVSIAAVEAHVFAFVSAGTLDAAGLWQLARRYRRPALGMVRFIVEPHLCRPMRQRLGLREINRDISGHANGLGGLGSMPELRGMIAATWQRNLYDANPLHALIGHLTNIGIETVLAYSSDDSGKDARKLARDTVRHARIERAATAAQLEGDEVMTFERHARAVQEDQDRLERFRIEQGLALGSEDMDGKGNLPRHLVEAALYERLLTRVRRQSWGQIAAQGGNLDDKAQAPGFAYMKHKNAQARLMLDLVDALRDESGAITVTASKARTVADTFRRRCHVAYGDVPKPPAKKSKAERFARWLRDLLAGWGYECVGREQLREGEERGARVYTYSVDPEIGRYSERLASRHLGSCVELQIGLEAA